MPKYDAIKALAIYKRAGMQAENLADFYDFCKDLELARTFQFPTLRQPPPSFLATMEEYIREAPRPTFKSVESDERKLLTYSQEEAPKEPEKPMEEEKEEPGEPEQEPNPEPEFETEQQLQPLQTTGDLLNLDEEVNPLVMDLDERNALTLAIVAPGDGNKASTCQDLFSGSTFGWELALVAAPSSLTSQPIDTKLARGFDKLLLDSLYEDEARRQQIASATYNGSLGQANPFVTNDPFAMSNSFAPPSNVQLAMVTQHQQYFQAQEHQQQYFQAQQFQQQYFQPQLQYYQPQLQCYQPQLQQQYFQAQQHEHQHFQQKPQYSANPAGNYNPFGDPFTDLVTLAPPPKQGNSSLL